MRIVLADDDARMRKAVRSLLAMHPDIEIVGNAADGWAAIECTREREPTIVLMDVVMAGMGGIEATRRLHLAHPSVKVIAMSLHDDRRFVEAMRTAGAAGYLLKDRLHEDLAKALRAVAGGGNWWGAGAKGSG
jgi:two-component system invasion response regulator UvrY